MEKSNNGDKGYIEEELYKHTGLEESEARPDGFIRGFLTKERGGALRGDADDKTEEAYDGGKETHRAEGENRGLD
jgi:hypothetical protein